MNLPKEVWEEVVGYSGKKRFWFGKVCSSLPDPRFSSIHFNSTIYSFTSNNTKFFDDKDNLAADILKNGELHLAFGQPNIEEWRPYNIDKFALKKEVFGDNTSFCQDNVAYLFDEKEKPSDYYTWKGYLYKYSILPLDTMKGLEYFVKRIDRSGPIKASFTLNVYEISNGGKQDL